MARLLDREGELGDEVDGLVPAMQALGVARLREGQLEVILAALRGHSVLAVRPTGGGKSLCFQLPSLLRPGTALVVAPLKALMSDQVAKLQQTKVPATFINSDLGPNEKRARLRLLEESVFKLLYCAPERFNPDLVRPEEVERLLAQLHPSYLVIDEAHCVDRWGDSFRPDYARLGELRERLGNPPVLAFTATATEQTQQRILKSLGLPEAQILVSGVDRRNIAFVRHKIRGFADRRASFIVPIVSRLQETGGKAMIFVPTIKIGEELQAALATEGVELPFYHAKFGTATERENLIGRFTGRLGPPLQAVICTNAFGMGIDVDDVRVVIHWQHPGSAEDYLQEFGRGGRDGKPALAILLTEDGDWDRKLLVYMAERSIEDAGLTGTLAEELLTRRTEEIEQMQTLARTGKCFRNSLEDVFTGGQRPRRQLWKRLLLWAFAERRKVHSAPFCCDSCDNAAAERVRAGQLPF